MKRVYKVREILTILQKDGWVFIRQKGSHMQFAHITKPGVVTVSFHSANDDLPLKIVRSIFKQAGLKEYL